MSTAFLRTARILLACATGAMIAPVLASDSPGLPAPHDSLAESFPGQSNFSPYAGRNFPTHE